MPAGGGVPVIYAGARLNSGRTGRPLPLASMPHGAHTPTPEVVWRERVRRFSSRDKRRCLILLPTNSQQDGQALYTRALYDTRNVEQGRTGLHGASCAAATRRGRR
jgi:hypothetical protein